MSEQNEYSDYSEEQLVKKINRFKTIQIAMSITAIVASLAIAVLSYMRGTSQGYPMIPIFLVVGIGYPFLAFGGMKKKMKTELDSRSRH